MICPACGYENFHPNATNCDLCHAVLKPDAPGAKQEGPRETMRLVQELVDGPPEKADAKDAKGAKGAKGAKKPPKKPKKAPTKEGEDDGPGLNAILFFLSLPVAFPVALWAVSGRRHPRAVAGPAWLAVGLVLTALVVVFGLRSAGSTPALVLGGLMLFADLCGSTLLFRRGESHLGGPGLLATFVAGAVLLGSPLLATGPTQLEGHAGLILCLDVSGNGTRAISGSEDAAAIVWDLSNGQRLAVLSGHREGISSVCLDATGSEAVTGSWDGQVKVWTLAPVAEQQTIKSSGGGVTSAALSPDGKLIAFGSVRGEIEVHFRAGGRASRPRGHEKSVDALAFSPDGSLLASGASDGSLSLWNPASGSQGPRLTGHAKALRALAWSSDSKMLFTAGLDGGVKVWDATSGGDAVASLAALSTSAPVRSLAAHPRGRWLLGVDAARNLIAWDMNGKKIAGSKQLEPGSYPPAAVAWTGDGRCLVALDKVIHFEPSNTLGVRE